MKKLPQKREFIANASALKRFVAFILDVVLINFVVGLPLQRSMPDASPTSFAEIMALAQNVEYLAAMQRISMITGLLTLAYFVILEYKVGQTLGKRLLNIHVTSETNHLTLWQCFVRSLYFIPFPLFGLLYIVDPIYLLFSKKKQRWTEKLSKTIVVEKYTLG